MHHFRLKSDSILQPWAQNMLLWRRWRPWRSSIFRQTESFKLAVHHPEQVLSLKQSERESSAPTTSCPASCTPEEQLEQCSRKGLRAADPSEKQGCSHNTKSHLFHISYWVLPNTLGTDVCDWFSPLIVQEAWESSSKPLVFFCSSVGFQC